MHRNAMLIRHCNVLNGKLAGDFEERRSVAGRCLRSVGLLRRWNGCNGWLCRRGLSGRWLLICRRLRRGNGSIRDLI